MDGSALFYDNWRTGEPNDSGGDEDCGELRPDVDGPTGVPGGWNDDSCDANNRYVCEAGP